MCGEKKELTTCQVTPAKTTRKEGEQRRAASMGRPSLEALAMAGADWTKVGAGGINGEDEEGAPPPPHLRAFDAFLEDVVPVDMLLAFDRDERRPSPEEDVKEKLKLWAKAVARKATTTKETTRGNACKCVRCT
jgi:hypothetical protein